MNLYRSIQNISQQTHQIWAAIVCSIQDALPFGGKSFISFQLTKRRVLIFLITALFGGVVMSVGGYTFMAHQEEDDSFCASCHTQPETTYFERSITGAKIDLATAHKQKTVRCIDCHSGEGLPGRVQAQMMGAQNAMKWYSGTAVQPAPLLYPIEDANCVKCHAEVLTEVHDPSLKSKLFGPKGHYHSYLTRWKEADTQAANCTTCHSGHDLGNKAKNTWLNSVTIEVQCDACHKVLGRD